MEEKCKFFFFTIRNNAEINKKRISVKRRSFDFHGLPISLLATWSFSISESMASKLSSS